MVLVSAALVSVRQRSRASCNQLVGCVLAFQMIGVAIFIHVAVIERPLRVPSDAHLMVFVIAPPDAHAGGSIEAQVLPGTRRRDPRAEPKVSFPGEGVALARGPGVDELA